MCPCVLALYSSAALHHTFSDTVRSSQCVLQSLSFTRMIHTEHWWTLCSQGYLCVSVWSTRATNQSVCDTSTVKTFTQLLITAVTISYQQLLVTIMLFYIGRHWIFLRWAFNILVMIIIFHKRHSLGVPFTGLFKRNPFKPASQWEPFKYSESSLFRFNSNRVKSIFQWLTKNFIWVT